MNAPSGDHTDVSLEKWFAALAAVGQKSDADQSTNIGANDGSADPVDSQRSHPPVTDSLLLTVSRAAMACEWEVLLNQHQYPSGAEQAMRALDAVERMERLLSVFDPRSEFSLINRFAALRPIPVAYDTLTLLRLAADVHQLSQGAFDITAGSLSQVWGFSRREGRMPSEAEIAQALEVVGQLWVKLDAEANQVRLEKPGVTLNSGAIGKGYALDRATQILVAAGIGDFMMHGGLSSVMARGNRQHRQTGGGWLVALKHPFRWEEQIGTIRLRDQALATSGSGKQFFHYQGKRYSHIIDPRTGWPAEGMHSVTVIVPSAAVADALSTALFVMGPLAARQFCAQHSEVSAILVVNDTKTGQLRLETHNLSPDMWIPGG